MKCNYSLPTRAHVDDYKCCYEVFEVTGATPSQDGFCIFHLPKTRQTWENESQTDEKFKVFQEGIDKIFKEPTAAKFDFRGFNFPRFRFDETFIFPVDFSYCVFSDDTEFMGISFEESVLFNDTEFDGDISFHYSAFKGPATFQNARFSKVVDFHRAWFQSSVSFVGAQFNTATFYEVTVGERFGDDSIKEVQQRPYASFDEVTFVESILFDDTYFEGEATFTGATFKGEAHFVANRGNVFGDYCDFRKVILTKDSNLTFFRTNLSRTSFHDTNLEHIIFRDVKWASAATKWQKLIRGSSYILWDEVRPLQGMRDWHDDAKTIENYRQLVTNYEGKRDYNAAEYFHVGEMEMQRKEVGERAFQHVIEQMDSIFPVTVEGNSLQKLIGRVGFSIAGRWGWFRHYLNAYGIYWFSSRYGTSYSHALLVLIGAIFLFSFSFLFAGFKPSKEHFTVDRQVIEYNLISDVTHKSVSVTNLISDYREALSYTLSIVTFQKERFYEPLSWESQYLLYFAVFILTGQAALVLFAIRRRFKR